MTAPQACDEDSDDSEDLPPLEPVKLSEASCALGASNLAEEEEALEESDDELPSYRPSMPPLGPDGLKGCPVVAIPNMGALRRKPMEVVVAGSTFQIVPEEQRGDGFLDQAAQAQKIEDEAVRLSAPLVCTDEILEQEYGYPAWPIEMREPDFWKEELFRMSTDPRHNPNLGRSMNDQEYWDEAARRPWAKALLRREKFWTERRNVWLKQQEVVTRGNKNREQLTRLLEDECPAEIKRILAPVLRFKFVEGLLVNLRDEASQLGLRFGDFLQRPEIKNELLAARRRLDGPAAAAEAEAQRLQDDLDGMMQAASAQAEEARRRQEKERGRTVIDMAGLKMALEFGQKCKKDGLVEWRQGNVEEALLSWRQGDETLRRFRAPARCVEENSLLQELHGATLRNIAQAALQVGLYTEALEAAESALALDPDDHKAWFRRSCALERLGRFEEASQSLARIEEISVGRADALRLQADCGRRRARLRALDTRYGVEQQRMLQRGLHRGVFSTGRAANEESKTGPALQSESQAQKPELEEVAEHPAEVISGQSPARSSRERKRLTKDGAQELLEDLLEAYSEPSFIQRVDKLAHDVRFEGRQFVQCLGPVALEVQRPVLTKWGFQPSDEGVKEMRAALQDHTRAAGADPAIKQLADQASKAVFGSPQLRMYDRIMLVR